MAQQRFRNTELESLHAGKVPDSPAGDYTDVKVVTPYGEIAWNDLSRLNDEEMKTLMIQVVNKTYTFLTMLIKADGANIDTILDGFAQFDPIPYWNDPELTKL
jgi:ligand-binding SRPBCC domain-containing protein